MSEANNDLEHAACVVQPRGRRMERSCEACGRSFVTKPYNVLKGEGRFCSRRCALPTRIATMTATKREKSKAAEDRFWVKVDRSGGPDACWPWLASCTPGGYGQFTVGGLKKKAHRFAYELTNGPLGADTLACHRCDVRACCNPSHIFPGTTQDNTADCVAKGRHGVGRKNGRARLNEDLVRLIRASAESEAALGERYGVASSTIGAIRTRQNWRHIP